MTKLQFLFIIIIKNNKKYSLDESGQSSFMNANLGSIRTSGLETIPRGVSTAATTFCKQRCANNFFAIFLLSPLLHIYLNIYTTYVSIFFIGHIESVTEGGSLRAFTVKSTRVPEKRTRSVGAHTAREGCCAPAHAQTAHAHTGR